MGDRKFRLHDGKRGAALAVRVTPRASRNEITEIQSDGTVKIRLTAPPVDGEANQLLVSFLSDVLGIAKSNIDIVAGTTGRDKLISITEMDKEEVHSRLLAYIS